MKKFMPVWSTITHFDIQNGQASIYKAEDRLVIVFERLKSLEPYFYHFQWAEISVDCKDNYVLLNGTNYRIIIQSN
jgi:hypothetical protein